MVIVILGPPSSGKTTLTHALEKRVKKKKLVLTNIGERLHKETWMIRTLITQIGGLIELYGKPDSPVLILNSPYIFEYLSRIPSVHIPLPRLAQVLTPAYKIIYCRPHTSTIIKTLKPEQNISEEFLLKITSRYDHIVSSLESDYNISISRYDYTKKRRMFKLP